MILSFLPRHDSCHALCVAAIVAVKQEACNRLLNIKQFNQVGSSLGDGAQSVMRLVHVHLIVIAAHCVACFPPLDMAFTQSATYLSLLSSADTGTLAGLQQHETLLLKW